MLQVFSVRYDATVKMSRHNLSSSSSLPDGADLACMANDMLSQLHVSHRVQRWTDINADVFVTLFEGLCGETLQDIVRNPKTWEDKVQNVQTVIDTLSLDVLNTSLSHITGEGVVRGNMADIHNLLEVFSGLLEYILERIGSDTSTENEDRLDDFEDDPDLVTSEVIDSILQRELGRSHLENSMSQRPYISRDGDTTKDLIALGQHSHLDLSSRPSANNTSELIALGGSSFERCPHRRASPEGRPKLNSSRAVHNGTYNEESTAELIREGEQLEQVYGPLPRSPGSLSSHSYQSRSPTRPAGPTLSRLPNTYPRSLSPTSLSTGSYLDLPPDVIRANRTAGPLETLRKNAFGAPEQAERGTNFTVPLEAARGTNIGIPNFQGAPPSSSANHSMTSDMFSSSLPLAGHAVTHNIRPGGHTLPSSQTSLHESLRSFSSAKGRAHVPSETSSRSSRIESMVESTAALARRAVNSSPLRGGSTGRLTPDVDAELSEALKTTLRSVHRETREIDQLASSAPSSPERPPVKSASKVRKASGKVPHRKVCFKTGRSSDEQTSSGESRSPPRNKKGSQPSTKKKNPPLSQHPIQDNTQPAPAPEPAAARLRNVRTRVAQVADELAPRRQVDRRALASDDENPIPETFQEYMDKYYGTIEKRDGLAYESKDDSMRHSDTELDYSRAESPDRTDSESRDADLSRNATSSPDRESRVNDTLDISADMDLRQMQEDLAWLRTQIRARKIVRFEDVLDDASPEHMDGLRHKLTQEERNTRGKADIIGKMYKYELGDFKEQFNDTIKDARKKAKETEREFKKKAIRAPKTNKYKPTKKYGVSVSTAGRGSYSRARSRTQNNRGRKRSVSASPSVGRKKNPEPDLLPWLLEEFPFLHLSTQTLHDLWRRSAKQMEQLSKAEKEVQRKKSKAQVQIEEAEHRQKILLDIMKKELQHNHRMKDLKERQEEQQLVKSRIREKRVASARSRRYYDEFQVRMRSKMLRKRTREEAVFRSLFKDGLSIQKDRIRELRRYAKEQRDTRNKRQQDELANLENYYRDQFSMLAESMNSERQDLDVREKAQAKVLVQMKSELRKKMESEIRQFQEQLYRDEDEEYFRQLDADRLRNTLQMARFQANV